MHIEDNLQRIIGKLESRTPLQLLLPQQIWDEALDQEIAVVKLPDNNRTAMLALRAALHLMNDSLDRSHAFAQQIEHDRTGAYWHGMMHRMEADYWNAQYWFRQAGNHPALADVRHEAMQVLSRVEIPEGLQTSGIARLLQDAAGGSGWHAAAFVDVVERLESGSGPDMDRLQSIAQQLQQCEMQVMLHYTLEWAVRG